MASEVFNIDDRVRYVPYHAYGDSSHPDCENGIVKTVTESFVFVRFGNHETAEGCRRDQLVKVGECWYN